MNKLTIPSILAATVLIAGIFAFMPVEKASTVHTTLGEKIEAVETEVGNVETKVMQLQDSAAVLRILELTDEDQDDNDIYTLDCTTDYTIIGLVTNMTTIGSNGVTDVITIDNTNIEEAPADMMVEVAFSGANGNKRVLETGNIAALADENIVLHATADKAVTLTTTMRITVLATDNGMCTLEETTPEST